jgi:thymidylate synthase (FAD)
MKVTLVRVTEDPVMAIEEAASVCYDSKPSPDGKIMDACYKSRHHSVLEFVQFHFLVEDVSRALLAQLTRHRMAGYAVRSQRYVSESEGKFVIPETISKNDKACELYMDVMSHVTNYYDMLVEMGVPKEDARYILPNATCTKLHMTFNLRSLINFMNERLCSRAQWEIRELAIMARDIILGKYPQIAKFLVPKCERDNDYPFCTEAKSCGRHPRLKDVYGEPVKHGRWIEVHKAEFPNFTSIIEECSVCGKIVRRHGDVEEPDRYCKHCGAKMDLGEDHHGEEKDD